MVVLIKILELFSGTQSLSSEFREAGHETFTVDYNEIFKEPEYFNTDLHIDIRNLTAEMVLEEFGKPDIIWASFDCTTYSIAAISHHRRKNIETGSLDAFSEYAKLSDEVNIHVLNLIKELNPKYYFIENPRGGLRKMNFMQDLPRYTVTYCLSGDTKVITKNGTFPIKELSGKTHTLLTTEGVWVDAPIKCYGKQSLQKITLSRAKRKKIVYATSNHRWFSGNKIIKTKDLQKGTRLNYVQPQKRKGLSINSEGVAMGFTYGDGWNLETTDKGFVMFCDEKQEMIPYFEGIGNKRWQDDTGTCSVVKLYGTPMSWKTETPSTNDDPSKIHSWLAGYLAADGTVHKNSGQISFSSSKKSDLETVRNLCGAIGIGTYSIVEYWRKGYGKVKTPLYQVTLMKSDVPRDMILRSKHREGYDKSGVPKHQARRWSVVSVEDTNRVEDVYCAEVPETHAFALEDGILTHNCQYGDFRMKPTDIFTNHPDPNFKPMCKNGAPCHVAAPRGSRTGTQGLKNAIERSRIPEDFCKHIVNISNK